MLSVDFIGFYFERGRESDHVSYMIQLVAEKLGTMFVGLCVQELMLLLLLLCMNYAIFE